MIQTFRVSHVAAFARWREDEDSEDVGWLINQIRSDEPSEAMLKGTAFHRALEHIRDGWEGAEIRSGEYRFVFTCDVAISLPRTRELRKGKDYGGIVISGQADGLGGKVLIDHKTTSHFDAEKYLEGWQHKFYLDIFEADRFDWYIWEMKEIDTKVYEVFGFHQLSQYRYPSLEDDCRRLALDFRAFADRYLPDYSFSAISHPENRAGATAVPGSTDPPSEAQNEQGEASAGKRIAMYGVNDPNGQLLAAGYDPADGVLRVQWKKGEGEHRGVPENVFVSIRKVPFAYAYYQKTVKGKYPYTKLR